MIRAKIAFKKAAAKIAFKKAAAKIDFKKAIADIKFGDFALVKLFTDASAFIDVVIKNLHKRLFDTQALTDTETKAVGKLLSDGFGARPR